MVSKQRVFVKGKNISVVILILHPPLKKENSWVRACCPATHEIFDLLLCNAA
jgi:hypothetical protein